MIAFLLPSVVVLVAMAGLWSAIGGPNPEPRRPHPNPHKHRKDGHR